MVLKKAMIGGEVYLNQFMSFVLVLLQAVQFSEIFQLTNKLVGNIFQYQYSSISTFIGNLEIVGVCGNRETMVFNSSSMKTTLILSILILSYRDFMENLSFSLSPLGFYNLCQKPLVSSYETI